MIVFIQQQIERFQNDENTFFVTQTPDKKQLEAVLIPFMDAIFTRRQCQKARINTIVDHLNAFGVESCPYILLFDRSADRDQRGPGWCRQIADQPPFEPASSQVRLLRLWPTGIKQQ